jgi:hypothetical protein
MRYRQFKPLQVESHVVQPRQVPVYFFYNSMLVESLVGRFPVSCALQVSRATRSRESPTIDKASQDEDEAVPDTGAQLADLSDQLHKAPDSRNRGHGRQRMTAG